VVVRRPFIKRCALLYGTVVLSVLSVCNVGVLWPNGWIDQDATWYGRRPWPRRHCVRWGPSSPHRKQHSSPHVRPISIVAKRSPISATAELLLRYASEQTDTQRRLSQYFASLPHPRFTLLTDAYSKDLLYKYSAVAETGDRLATIDMGQKSGGCCVPFRGEGVAASPSNTVWLGPRSTSVPSGILSLTEKWGCCAPC